jgi:hypothetical protein
MQYILIQTHDERTLYQEIQRGEIVRICDLNGNTVTNMNGPHWIIDVSPTPPTWARPDEPLIIRSVARSITRTEFRNRFTMQEKIAIYTEAETNIIVRVWLDDLLSADTVDLNGVNVRNGIDTLVSLNLISSQRGEEIINA